LAMGCVTCTCAGWLTVTFVITEVLPDRDELYANVTEVNINIIADAVVILLSSGSGPSVPKSD